MSEVRVTTLKDTSGSNSSTTAEIASGRAKAWVNFNGNGVVSARASFNVNSMTDNGVGNYTVTLSSGLADTNAAVLVSSGGMDTGAVVSFQALGSYNSSTNFILSTTQIRVFQNSSNAANQTDPHFFCVAAFR